FVEPLKDTPGGGAWPRMALNNAKFAAAMCLTSSANVLVPLKSPSVGAKKYLSAGIASAAGTICFSTTVSCVFIANAMVGDVVCTFDFICARATPHIASTPVQMITTVARHFVFMGLSSNFAMVVHNFV